ncbi:hypothetical protein MIND_00059300 [Mycena indigotica]|uniref:Uncharacterized protein n=1 Tax=Mycena indigotica TaxID=2126181 RepID=A0A8H6WK79_9AGAR|nr:uncharacterized protein MIND_00059300 [Mycena indigotica]KAF7315444.1 hypothetical protein MIND_00059300 [Mycena indigotica]
MTRPRPPSLRLDHLGLDPSSLVGRVLKTIKHSEKHPSLTLHFLDGTRIQIMVDGYSPAHPGVPKELEMSPSFRALFNAGDSVDLTVTDCALITLSDKAFALESNDQWDQRHLGVAFKFSAASGSLDGLPDPWHCVWATLEEHDQHGSCIFRTYEDVYLEELQRSPRKARHRKQSGP